MDIDEVERERQRELERDIVRNDENNENYINPNEDIDIQLLPQQRYRKEMICFAYFILISLGFRFWIFIVNEDNVILEVVAGVLTVIVLCLFYYQIRRQQHLEQEERRRFLANPYLFSVHNIVLGEYDPRINPRPGGLDPQTLDSLERIIFNEEQTNELTPEEIEAQYNPSKDQCAICLSDYITGDRLIHLSRCHHYYHETCVIPWLQQHSTCPLCKQTVLIPSVGSSVVIGSEVVSDADEDRPMNPQEIRELVNQITRNNNNNHNNNHNIINNMEDNV